MCMHTCTYACTCACACACACACMRTAVVDYLREHIIITTITKLTNDNEAHTINNTTFTWATHSGIKKSKATKWTCDGTKKGKKKSRRWPPSRLRQFFVVVRDL